MPRVWRIPMLIAAVASLLAGLLAGLQRTGWIESAGATDLALWHGPLMVAGFFATLIGLERAVALGERWLYAAPALSGLSGLLLIAGGAPETAAALFVVAGTVLSFGALLTLRLHPELFMAVLTSGVVAWLVGNLIWLIDGLSPAAILWWAAFLVIVIAGERLELSRVLQHGRGVQALFLAAAALFVAGVVTSFHEAQLGARTAGLGLICLAAWLGCYDVARRTLRQRQLTRYMAVCLLAGYVWLGIGGAVALIAAEPLAGPAYDALLHALFVGFVFSMVFAHAPVILPAVIGVAVPYGRRFYLPLLLLHLSVALRLLADWAGAFEARSWAGMLNAAAILLFFLLVAVSAAGASLSRRRGRSRTALPENRS